MNRLSYTREELMADHAYARPQLEGGYRLHGGFDADGSYVSPRTLNRWPAVHAWQGELARRGAPLVDATVRLLKRGPYPSIDQQRYLLGNGFGETLWNALTITGIIEARGGLLAQAVAPDFQQVVVEDISATALGHLNTGLLTAHGLDEAGDKSRGQGGHDDMWFSVRDLLFGKGAYPIPEVPQSLARPEGERRIPEVPKEHEAWILLLMNVLLVEIKAENFFSFCQAVMTDPANFKDRHPAARHAAELVERIRTDEAIHVAYLQTALSELRSFTIKTVDGKTVPAAPIIDKIWEALVEWHTVTNAQFARAQSRDAILERLKAKPDGAVHAARFDALEFKAAAE